MDKLSDAELDIMRTLWESKAPMKAGEIVRRLSGVRSWKTPTAHVLLGRLCDKGFVDADRSGYYHKFTAKIGENEYLRAQSEKIAGKPDGSLKSMVASLIDEDGITDEDIVELAEMLSEKKREIEEKRLKEGDGGK